MRTWTYTSKPRVPGGLRAAGRAFDVEKTYAGRIALYLPYYRGHGLDCSSPSRAQPMAMMRWLVDEPMPPRSGQAGGDVTMEGRA
ncbi:hypothetical protein [Streptosporangium sp. NPDC048865]|uniref:hypothetical protein n=1 Tax=Streptosporangium sp. NPDC048865 TaxID=3155766 RepID=UPI00344AEA13